MAEQMPNQKTETTKVDTSCMEEQVVQDAFGFIYDELMRLREEAGISVTRELQPLDLRALAIHARWNATKPQ